MVEISVEAQKVDAGEYALCHGPDFNQVADTALQASSNSHSWFAEAGRAGETHFGMANRAGIVLCSVWRERILTKLIGYCMVQWSVSN